MINECKRVCKETVWHILGVWHLPARVEKTYEIRQPGVIYDFPFKMYTQGDSKSVAHFQTFITLQ